MIVTAVVIEGVGLLVLCTAGAIFIGSRTDDRSMTALARSLSLPETPEVVSTVIGADRRLGRGALAGMIVGILAAGSGMLLLGAGSISASLWIYFTGALACGCVGAASAALAREYTRQKGHERVARMRAVSVSDYRSPLERWLPRLTIAIAVASFSLSAAAEPAPSKVPLLTASYLCIAIGALAISEIAARLLVRSGQPAGTPLDLAWDDALRARALESIGMAPMFLGGYFAVAQSALSPTLGNPANALGQLLGLSTPIFFIVWMVCGVAKSKPPRFVRQLWPELAEASAASGDYWAQVAEHERMNSRRASRRAAGTR